MTAGALVIVALGGYLLGAVPSGLIAGRVIAGLDVRQYGSGKMGATNVARTVGWGPAGIVLLADVLKGVLAVLFARLVVGPDVAAYPLADGIAGIAALLGHSWPVYVGFRGGRGVATGIGSLLVMAPGVAIIGVLIGVGVILATDVVSLGSVAATTAALVMLLAAIGLGWLPAGYWAYAVIGSSVIIARHGDNIVRVLRGQERRLGLRHRLLAALRRRAVR